MSNSRPNIVFVFADQWRAQATGYAGNPAVRTPNLDQLATEGINFTHAISWWPVCSPWRATFLTGQYPLKHGVFVNDVPINPDLISIADAFNAAGYATAYIGKWHVDGHGRSSYIPPERQQGFQFWNVLECTHDYNHSPYYAQADPTQRLWDGYDAEAQTRAAQRYIQYRDPDEPFLLVLSWGPPHNPYQTAPEAFRALYNPADIPLRPNVPDAMAAEARAWLAGYYAHCSALDAYVGDLRATLEAEGIADDTIFIFTSDHGDMLGSQGQERKQRPWDESIRVPFLLHYPPLHPETAWETSVTINSPDIMPTLLGLCDIPIPATVDGFDFSGYLLREAADPSGGAALLACFHPFGEWPASRGGREFRGLRTVQYTYARALDSPWLLYDNHADPYQLNNLIDHADYADLRNELDNALQARLDALGDEFLPGMTYIERWGYTVDETGTVPYTL
jgi:arylsulfatase A-like enzyme